MSLLQSASDKLWQAQIHVEALWQAIEAFDKAHAYGLVSQNNPDGWYSTRLHIHVPPPIELTLIAGDALHNARSALDHAIYELSTARGKPRNRLAFPLYSNRVEYLKSKQSGLWKRQLAGVDPKYWTLIEREQPFRRANRRLGALAEFDNIDKHRVVHATLARAGTLPIFRVQPAIFMPHLEFRSWPFGKRMKEGTEVWAWRRRPGTNYPHVGRVNVDVEYAVTVAFGTRNLTRDAIQDIVNRVGMVVRDLGTVKTGRVPVLESRPVAGGFVLMMPGSAVRTHLRGPLLSKVYGEDPDAGTARTTPV